MLLSKCITKYLDPLIFNSKGRKEKEIQNIFKNILMTNPLKHRYLFSLRIMKKYTKLKDIMMFINIFYYWQYFYMLLYAINFIKIYIKSY